MESTKKKNELKDCRYVDLKLRTRDPHVRQISNYFCHLIESEAPKRTREATVRQAKYAVRGILADLFRAREAGNAVVAISLSEGRYSSKKNSSVSYQSARMAIKHLVRSQTIVNEGIPPIITQHKGFRSPSGYKDNTKLKLNEDSIVAWLRIFEDREEQCKDTKIFNSSSKELDAQGERGRVKLYLEHTQYKEDIDYDKLEENRTINQIINRTNTTPITSRLNYTYYSCEPRSVISLRDNDGIGVRFEVTPDIAKMSNDIVQYNEYLSDHVVQLFKPDSEYPEILKAVESKLHERGQRRDYSRTRSQMLHREQSGLYRVFNRATFECGGRHYGGYWQNLPRAYRPFLTINGHPTVELDFKSLHPTMIYHRVGLKLDRDPYELEDLPIEFRETVKKAFMALLNATDRSRRLRSIEKLPMPHGWNARRLIEAIERAHEPIRDVFRSDTGVKLQRLDSDIAAIVMKRMREAHNALALPVHDSFIVTEDQESNLLVEMKAAYAEVMRSDDIRIDAKPTISEVLSDTREESLPLRFLRRIQGAVDASSDLERIKLEPCYAPLVKEYGGYLGRISNYILLGSPRQ